MGMRWLLVFALIVAGLGSIGVAGQVRAAEESPELAQTANCTTRAGANGATWKLCFPASPLTWNDSVVVWAHGYEAPGYAPTYQDTLPDGTSIPNTVTALGFALITSTYPANGLVVNEAKTDLLALVNYFNLTYPATPLRKIYLVGASMGGLIATQLAEQTTGTFNGALSLCGITGDFKRQITYWGNFNALYRTIFPQVVAGWNPPPGITTTRSAWESTYQPAVIAAATSNLTATQVLLTASRAPIDPSNITSALTTVVSLAYFTFLSAEDTVIRLGGNPFENRTTTYVGSASPAANFQLNRAVPRLAASPTALASITTYETTGRSNIPLVTLHTTLDHVVPIAQNILYTRKVPAADLNTKVFRFMVNRYGHCTFTPTEVLAAFGLLVAQVTGTPPPAGPSPFLSAAQVTAVEQQFDLSEGPQTPFTRQHLPLVHR